MNRKADDLHYPTKVILAKYFKAGLRDSRAMQCTGMTGTH